MELNNNNKKAWRKDKELVKRFIITSLLLLIVFSFFASISHRLVILRSDFLANILPGVLVDLTNTERLAFNLNQLSVNPLLEEAARRKAEDMAEKGYFAHVSPEGISPWYWFDSADYDFLYAGENLAVNFSDSNDVVGAWIDSPGHRANLLNTHFTEIGIATAKGLYQGRETTFVVQMFGQPSLRAEGQLAQNNIQLIEKRISEEEKIGEQQVESVILKEEDNFQKFIAVERAEPALSAGAKEDQEIKVAGRASLSYSSLFERIIVSPTLLLGIIYTVLGSVVIFVMFLSLIVELKRHHYLHIIYGVSLLLLILVLYVVYRFALTEVEILGYLA